MASFSLLLGIFLITFFATFVRSTLGFGESLIAVPMLVHLIPLDQAVPLSVLTSVLIAVVILLQDHQKVEIKSAKGLIIYSIIGLPIGFWLLLFANDTPVKFALGLVLMVFSIYSIFTKKKRKISEDNRAWMGVCGFLAGVMGGAYGLNGPPLIYYGNLRQWTGSNFRATLQAYFLCMGILGCIGYAIKGLFTQQVLFYFATTLPAIIPAIFLGRYVHGHLPDGQQFFKYVYSLLALLGLILALQNL